MMAKAKPRLVTKRQETLELRLMRAELGLAAVAQVLVEVNKRIWNMPLVPRSDKERLNALVREVRAHIQGEADHGTGP